MSSNEERSARQSTAGNRDADAGAEPAGATESRYRGVRATVMGLGLHGGGLASARYLLAQGAEVTVTDLRSEAELASSLRKLEGLPVRLVLGRHEDADFCDADLVVKNPAVRRSSSYLSLARRVETDISLFLRHSRATVIAVTGTKGKSTTAAAIHHCLTRLGATSRLGGNITVSPLEFADKVRAEDYVVLELSSFQLGDLQLVPDGMDLLRPRVSVITNLMSDHMDYYASFEDYFLDKARIFGGQQSTDYTVVNVDDEHGRRYAAMSPATVISVSAASQRITSDEKCNKRALQQSASGSGALEACVPQTVSAEELVPQTVALLGRHNRANLLFAAAAVRCLGFAPNAVADAVAEFPGVPHRMEKVTTIDGVDYYNDTAATIVEAALAAVESFDRPVHLIAGGSDKGLDVSPFRRIAARARAVYLLAGSATDRIAAELDGAGRRWHGPYPELEAAVKAAAEHAKPGEVVVLSPGCASFGMFRNEFDRGDQFRELVCRMARG